MSAGDNTAQLVSEGRSYVYQVKEGKEEAAAAE